MSRVGIGEKTGFETPKNSDGTSEGVRARFPSKWKRRKNLLFIFIGSFFLGAAFSLKILETPPRWVQRLVSNEESLSFSQVPELTSIIEEDSLPKRILIPKVRLDLPVFPTKVVNDQWETTQKGASYLMGSGVPGRVGNTVIYGHNKNHLFGPIRWLGKGDKIKVMNKKGEEFIYQIIETRTVSPQMIEVLAPTKDDTLTLYTCTGLLDQERFVVGAKLRP